MSHCDWMNTWTGKQFWPLEPDDPRNVVDIFDIAHALANTCRYSGHCYYYSVAEHSVLLSQYFIEEWGRGGSSIFNATKFKDLARAALFHDASEAYLTDVIRPVKYWPEFAFYREAERKLQARIFRDLGLPEEIPAAVLEADSLIIHNEAANIVPRRHPEWSRALEPGLYGPNPLGWSPEWAEREFLVAAEMLGFTFTW